MPIPKVRVGVERKAIMKKAITLLEWEKQSGYNYEYIKTSFELHIRYIVLYGIYFWILYTEGPLLISLSTLRDFGYVFELHRNGKVMRRLLFCEVFFSTSHYVCAKSLCPICLPNKKDEERLYIYRVCLQKPKKHAVDLKYLVLAFFIVHVCVPNMKEKLQFARQSLDLVWKMLHYRSKPRFTFVLEHRKIFLPNGINGTRFPRIQPYFVCVRIFLFEWVTYINWIVFKYILKEKKIMII